MFFHDPSHDTTLHKRLQDGIYFRREEFPRRSYRIVFLNLATGDVDRARAAIAAVWQMLHKLRDGIVADLQPADGEPFKVADGNLTCLLGFGARLFASHRGLVAATERPADVGPLRHDAHGPYPRLKWIDGHTQSAEADLAIQLIADTELAVSRAVVEIARLIALERLPLEFSTFYGGFNRDDRRSWLNFHDGISNIATNERGRALEVAVKDPPRDPAWMVGGTYMVFLRLALNLSNWWDLTRAEQELSVGRDKLTGCPIDGLDGSTPVPMAGCPIRWAAAGAPPTTAAHRDPRPPADQVVAFSHIHRANPTRSGPDHPGSNRIFRQGYEFLEALDSGTPRAGLNFVSFQRDLSRFTAILTTPRWLSTVNFGGPGDRDDMPNVQLARVISGGYYAVPPRGEPFPGAEIFQSRGADG
jgi:deferrochelatase/peroxidase EfeB